MMLTILPPSSKKSVPCYDMSRCPCPTLAINKTPPHAARPKLSIQIDQENVKMSRYRNKLASTTELSLASDSAVG